ncbi:unnamed protein product [marine sediment metagenome]|uniref:Uncharacterized protein n=1 Tax=marine sediment metagenome TaxID=412755 RepID=X1UCF3_9ZZZZ
MCLAKTTLMSAVSAAPLAETAGIYIANDCVNTSMVIQHNVIGPYNLPDNPLAIGIDDNWGKSWCIDNFINADIPIQHAGGGNYLIANHETTSPGGAGSVETGGSS